jgi:bifunctional DNA-binding transcriptional regulator/antitoxin component of YhaV-PrlF toxin-antitoxin module
MGTVILQQSGLDYIVNIPSELVHRLDLKPGVIFEIRTDKQRLTLEPLNAELAEVQGIHQDLMDQYQPAFEKLAE